MSPRHLDNVPQFTEHEPWEHDSVPPRLMAIVAAPKLRYLIRAPPREVHSDNGIEPTFPHIFVSSVSDKLKKHNPPRRGTIIYRVE